MKCMSAGQHCQLDMFFSHPKNVSPKGGKTGAWVASTPPDIGGRRDRKGVVSRFRPRFADYSEAE
jgi:hypothetical protein